MKDYYTYAYLREDGTPYYIGKGKNNRIFNRDKKDIKPPREKSRVIILKKNLTEEEAFKHEIYMISVFGRKDLGTGILRNMTNGGEGSSGRILSEETKLKISNSKKGIPLPEKVRKKMIELKRNVSQETREKLSVASKGRKHSEETIKKFKQSRGGKNHPNYGKVLTEEIKTKISNSKKGKSLSEETKKKISDSLRKKKKEE